MIIRPGKLKKHLWWFVPLVLVIYILTADWFWRFFYPLPYKEYIFKYAIENRIDPYLVAALIRTESNFSRGAESQRGARGIMQIMPETGEWIAEKMNIQDFHPDQLYNTETNIRFGCWYLADLKKEFNGNLILALAAYNGGRGNVKKWLKDNRWTGDLDDVDKIPFPETRQFVQKVIKSYKIYLTIYDTEE